MPKDIKMPDGKVVRFPDGMSDDEIRAKILKKFPDLATEGEPAMTIDGAATRRDAVPAETPSEPEPIQPEPEQPWHVSAIGNIAAGLNTLGDVASFGVAPAIQRTVMNAFNPGSGDALQRDIDMTTQANPAGAAAGFAAAIPTQMALTAPVAAVSTPFRAANAFLKGGGVAGNLGRMAGAGATAGAVEAAAHGGDLDEIAVGAGLGGILGPVGGVVAPAVTGAVEKVIQGPGAKAWRYLAGKIGASADDLERYVNDFTTRTGRQPSLQQVVSDHDAGVIAQFGEMQPHAGQVLRAGARESAQAPTGSARAALPNAPKLLQNVAPGDVSVTTLLNARDRATDTAVNAIRDNPVQLPDWMVDDINKIGALTSRKWAPVRERLSDGTATIDDIDKIRKRLQKMNNAEFSADVDDLLDDLKTHTPAEYTKIMDDYAAASRYIDSFSMGQAGTDLGSVTNAGARKTLTTAEGRAGADLGAAMREAHQTASSAAPGRLRPSGDQGPGANLGTAAMDVAIGAPISGARQTMIAVTKIAQGLNLPPRLQREIAEGFTSTNPQVRRATIERLRRANVSNENIRRLRIAASGATGAVVSSTTVGSTPLEDQFVEMNEAR